jgi:hypothetical protein
VTPRRRVPRLFPGRVIAAVSKLAGNRSAVDHKRLVGRVGLEPRTGGL